MVTALYTHPDMLDHEPGRNHPERPERLQSVLGALKEASGLHLEPRAAPPARWSTPSARSPATRSAAPSAPSVRPAIMPSRTV